MLNGRRPAERPGPRIKRGSRAALVVAKDPTRALVFYNRAKQALAKAHRVDEVKSIGDKATAMRAYAIQAKDRELQDYATEIRMRAERRAGELLGEMEKRRAGRPPKNRSSMRTDLPSTLADLGISKNESARWQALAEASPEHFEKALEKTREQSGAILASAPVLRELRREEYEAEAAKLKTNPPKLPEGKYSVVVTDPPWPTGEPGRTQGVGGEAGVFVKDTAGMKYSTMSLAEIGAQVAGLVKRVAAADCHVFLWTTQAFLFAAKEILDECGLTYRFTMVWKKPGGPQPLRYPQYNCEFVICATQGKPKFVATKDFWACFEAPRGQHSEKPEKFYQTLRRVTVGRRLDAYNRRPIDGFECWGSETSSQKRAA